MLYRDVFEPTKRDLDLLEVCEKKLPPKRSIPLTKRLKK